jgi:hypothetical protein
VPGVAGWSMTHVSSVTAGVTTSSRVTPVLNQPLPSSTPACSPFPRSCYQRVLPDCCWTYSKRVSVTAGVTTTVS